MTRELVERICRFTSDAPVELVNEAARRIQQADADDWHYARSRILDALPYSATRHELAELLDYWHQHHAKDFPLSALALGILSADTADQRRRNEQRIDLVWTGPGVVEVPMRRIDQALLEVIQSARRTLHIVSFAAYRIQRIVEAMIEAAKRGVDVRLYLETRATGKDKLRYDAVEVLRLKLQNHVRIFVWPHDKRHTSADGKYGSLHAKLAVCDHQRLLISSANLTEYAHHLNIEAGLLVTGGSIPAQIEEQLTRLVESDIFTEIRQS